MQLGISPPYDDPAFVLSGEPKGSQIYYVAFPKTRLSCDGCRDYAVYMYFLPESKSYKVNISLASGLLTRNRREDYLGASLAAVGIIYVLDSNFVPCTVYLPDGSFTMLNQLLADIGQPPYRDELALTDSLKSEVIVYRRDSIVYHPAAGIFYHEK